MRAGDNHPTDLRDHFVRRQGPTGELFTDNKQRVPRAFDEVAPSYDLLSALNPGYHRHLRWSARRLALPRRGRVLDLCCGTGLSTRALLEEYPEADITAVDASPAMLARARAKSALSRVRFIEGDAMDPATSGVAGPFDGVLMAYGIRNMPDPDRCLDHIKQFLVPGGAVCFHEYSVRDSRLRRAIWTAVLGAVILPAALVTTGSTTLFRYLHRSVVAFDSVSAFEARLRRAGYTDVETRPMDGWQRGIVHSFLARRPRL